MIKAVIFDMDGVIINSLKSNIMYFQDLLELFGYARPKANKVKSFFHLTSKDTIKALLPKEKNEKIIEIWKKGAEIYPKYIDYIKLESGIKNILEKFSKKYKLAIVSSRRRSGIRLVLNKFKMKKYFKVIIGFEDYTHPKPDPEPLLKASEALKIKPEEAVYIGDTKTDFQAAKKARMRSIIYSKKKIDISPKINSLKRIIPLIDSMVS